MGVRHKYVSFVFLISIPFNFVLGALALYTFLLTYSQFVPDLQIWSAFLLGVLLAIVYYSFAKVRKFRTIIHELKHALLVIFSGNRVTDFHFDTDTGHVRYQMRSDKVHFGPWISLAPYYLPLFSFPVLALCILIEGYNDTLMSFVLGLSMAADIMLGLGDLHPHQTDIKSIRGGIFISGPFLASHFFVWTLICSLWVLSGRTAYVNMWRIFRNFFS